MMSGLIQIDAVCKFSYFFGGRFKAYTPIKVVLRITAINITVKGQDVQIFRAMIMVLQISGS